MKLIYAMLLLFSIKATAQYPFEKHPAIKYKVTAFKKLLSKNKDSLKSAIAIAGNYSFVIKEYFNKKGGYACSQYLYNKIKLIYHTTVDDEIFYADSLYMADINGDGLIDIKIIYPNAAGSGLAGSRVWKLYLFNTGNNNFKKITFGDFYDGNKEYDFNGDGNYEIIGQQYISYKWHAYWLFDLYNYKNGRLVNVGNKYNYPIMIKAFENHESYQITKKVSRRKMKTFSEKLPEFYSVDK